MHPFSAHRPNGRPKMVLKRKAGVEYSVADRNGHFFVMTNDGATNKQVFFLKKKKKDEEEKKKKKKKKK